MSEKNVESKKYPGPEHFWRSSPELIRMQEEIERFWKMLEETPSLPERGILSKNPGEIVAIRKPTNQCTDYTIFELESTPTVMEHYAAKPYYLRARASDKNPQIIIEVQKWPSGYRIDGSPVTKERPYDTFVHRDEAEFKDMPKGVKGEGLRLVTRRLMEKNKRLSEAERKESKRILNLVKSAVEKTK